jgi:hypothetical protein
MKGLVAIALKYQFIIWGQGTPGISGGTGVEWDMSASDVS